MPLINNIAASIFCSTRNLLNLSGVKVSFDRLWISKSFSACAAFISTRPIKRLFMSFSDFICLKAPFSDFLCLKISFIVIKDIKTTKILFFPENYSTKKGQDVWCDVTPRPLIRADALNGKHPALRGSFVPLVSVWDKSGRAASRSHE